MSASPVVAIVDPRPAWCGTIAARVIESGFGRVRRWALMTEALSSLLDDPPGILLLSRRSARDLPHEKMMTLKRRTAIVLLVEPGETVAADELAGFGMDALLASDASAESVSDCLSTVAAGHAWLDPALLLSLTQRTSLEPDWGCLSARELQVARLAALGLSNKRIARTLRLSDGTVKIHMHHIFSKLGVAGRTALAAGCPAEQEAPVPDVSIAAK